MTRHHTQLLWIAALLFFGCGADGQQTVDARKSTPTKPKSGGPVFHPVKPVTRNTGAPRSEGGLRIANGRFFSYALPDGWQVGEEGQFALTMVAPDKKALTLMVGNAGVPPNYPPSQFVYQKLMALQPEGLQLGPPSPAKPAPGFAQAVQFEVRYAIGGAPCRGVAKCNINVGYDAAVMAVTAALSESSQWAQYEKWLPQVADQVSANNGAAFGVRGIMAQNLRNSVAYAEAARNYREWSRNTWNQVANDRAASSDRRNAQFRENLGGIHTYAAPFGDDRKVELPQTYKHYWMDRQGNVVGTDNPGADPNVGSTVEWRRMPRTEP